MAKKVYDGNESGARQQQLSTVTAGEKVKMSLRVNGLLSPRTVTVGAYHPTPPGNDLGHWFCVTHQQHFDNQFQKDSHIHEGAHRLAWICHEHGIEQPLADPVVAESGAQ